MSESPAIPPPPGKSRVQVAATPGSLTILVPRMRLGCGGLPLLLAVSYVMCVLVWTPLFPQIGEGPAPAVLVMLMLHGMPLFAAVLCTHLVFQRTVIQATAETLTITTRSPLRSRMRAFPRASITGIYVRDAEPDRSRQGPQPSLAIATTEVYGLLDGHDIPELQYLADLLRGFYGMKGR
jgi:hypothetical protein